MNKVSIAITGHTNVGKTTLLRTLTKTNFGNVADKANVSDTTISVSHDIVYATFIDCPGFTQATNFLKYQNLKLNNVDQNTINTIFSQEDLQEMRFDKAAFDGIKGSDIALYVISLESVPEPHHTHEIQLIRLKQKNIIAIFNKSQPVEEVKQNTKLQERLRLWEKFIRDQKIDYYIKFDAFWDTPSKVQEVYKFIENILQVEDEHKLHLFRENLKEFKNKQNILKKELAKELANCVVKCQTYKKQFTKSEGKNPDEINRIVVGEITDYINSFVQKAAEKYKFSDENPINPLSNKELNYKYTTKFTDVATGGGAGAALGGALGGGLGAIFGVAIAVFNGGTTSPTIPAFIQTGATIGAAFLGGAGSIVGVVAVWDNQISISLCEKNLTLIAKSCLGVLWELYYHGYGNKEEDQDMPEIERSKFIKLLIKIEEYYEKTKINFLNSKESQISEWCVNFFKELDNWK